MILDHRVRGVRAVRGEARVGHDAGAKFPTSLATRADCLKERSLSLHDGCKATLGQRRIYPISRTPKHEIAVVSAI